MAAYRCYLLDCQSRIAAFEILECDDDGAAIHAAQTLAEARGFRQAEVWDRNRLVDRVERLSSS